MRQTLLVFALTLVAIPLEPALTPDGFAHPSPRLNEFYSWPEPKAIWNFRLLPSPSGVNIPVEIIFNKKFRITGIEQLERKISLLPADTRIIWMSGISAGQSPTKESSKLVLPPLHMVEQVKRYAEQHGVQVEIPGTSPD